MLDARIYTGGNLLLESHDKNTIVVILSIDIPVVVMPIIVTRYSHTFFVLKVIIERLPDGHSRHLFL